jgi:hypothetical protein
MVLAKMRGKTLGRMWRAMIWRWLAPRAAEHLGAHQARGPRPGYERDDERDDEEAAAQNGGEHDG